MLRLALLALVSLATLVACARGSGGQGADAIADTAKPIDAAIDGNGCATQPCSILPQCGCVGGAVACDLDLSDNMGTVCRSVNDPGKETAACNGADKCDRGYVCLGGSTYATCKKYCTANADCGTPRGRCAIDLMSGSMPIMDVPPACSSNCDPLPTAPPVECPATYKCGLFTALHSGTAVKIADCSPAGIGTQGADCKAGNLGNDSMCAQGFMCTTLDAGTTYTCRRVCNKSANTGCSGGQTCIGFSTPHTIDVEYGVCN